MMSALESCWPTVLGLFLGSSTVACTSCLLMPEFCSPVYVITVILSGMALGGAFAMLVALIFKYVQRKNRR